MAVLTPDSVLDTLRMIIDPDEGFDMVRLGLVKGLEVQDRKVSFTVVVKRPGRPFEKQVAEACRRLLREQHGADLDVRVEVDSAPISLGEDLLSAGPKKTGPSAPPGIGAFVAVASGKGGVGKSTVAANFAVALAQQGYRVGLVDTDIYGPSVPTMFGLRYEKPRVNDRRKIIPLEKHGVKLLSMGFLVEEKQAVIWRGPMVSSAVRQFLGEAEWGELDILVLDLPPGTGDIQLTIVQTIPLTGAIIVSTPQEVALADARKGIAMFNNVNVPVLGLVENMAYFSPPDMPDRKYYLFGEGGVRKLAEARGLPLLGQIPIEEAVREDADLGTPIVKAHPASVSAQAFQQMTSRAMKELQRRMAEQPATLKTEILYR